MFDLFSDFFEGFDVYPVYHEVTKCPGCGYTLAHFQKSGRVGCAQCYETFRTPLATTVRRMHQNPVHKGKIPSRCAGELRQKRRYEELKKQIAQAVSAEDYETAAKLHKELKEIGGEQA